MATFVRLLGWLRPYRRGVILSGLLAAVAMVMTVAIPWLTGRAIDQIRDGDKPGLVTLALVILAAGVLRLALTVARRLVAGRVSLGVELDLRNGMYQHLQKLELGFFDRQQTGQLMSRATVDLQSVRFFLGYGLVFMLQSALTIVLAAGAMFAVQPGPGGASRSSPCRSWSCIAARYGRRSRPALQELQQRIAELTADVEENIGGVRVVKSFAREDRQLERFRGGVGRVFDQAMVATRLQAFYNPFIGFLPQLGLAAILFFGGRQVIDGRLTHRRVQRVLRLPAHAAVADAHARHLARAGPAGDGGRRARLPDPRPRAADRLAARTRRRCRRARATSSCAASRCTTRARRARRCATSTSTCRRARRSRSSAPPARARRRSSSSSRGSTTSPPAPCSSTAPTCARSTSPRCARAIAVVDDDPFLFSATRGREHRLRARRRDAARRSSSPRGARRPTSSSRACPTATTRAWASAG